MKNLSPQAKETWFRATIVNVNEYQQSGRTEEIKLKAAPKKMQIIRLIEYFLKAKMQPEKYKIMSLKCSYKMLPSQNQVPK